jgi:hypothetical protein
MSIVPWSYSKLKAFDTCPKQFYHTHVLKQFPYQETEATRYGNEFHTAAELHIRDGVPLPEKFAFAQKVLDSLKAKKGEKLCEKKFGITKKLKACAFDAKNVWFRGIADLIIIDDDLAWVIDYKTGKSARYADSGQLELMALAVFAHYPKVQKVRAALVFVVCSNIVKKTYTIENTQELWAKWLANYAHLDRCVRIDVWNPKPSGLCRRHCPVTECPHNGAN